MKLFAQTPARTVPESKPDWAAELYDSFQSGASGQFILYGNVRDRLAIGGRLVSIERYIEDELAIPAAEHPVPVTRSLILRAHSTGSSRCSKCQ